VRIVVDENIPGAAQAFGPLGEVRTLPGRTLSRADLAQADALVVRSVTKVDHALLDGTPVRFVGTATIGVDHVDRAYLAQAGIGFASAAGCNARSVVEHVVTVLLEIAVASGITLGGKTLGIVGHGNIGSRLARVAPALGLRVLVNDPPLQRAGHPGPFTALNDLLDQADFLTLHVPKIKDGPDRTIGLIGAEQLARLRPTAWLVNSSRGDVVQGAALLEALKAGRFAGAVLDVWEDEPFIDRDLMDRVLLATPHSAGYSLEGKMNGTTMMHDALVAHFGLSHLWRPDLSSPANPRVELDALGSLTDTQLLLSAARSSYPIREDNARLRAGRGLEASQWGLHFDRLRREYPVRREFANYGVVLHGNRPALAQALAGLGFQVEGNPAP
jgi:erythronate-4-phosphate dehydrogenase